MLAENRSHATVIDKHRDHERRSWDSIAVGTVAFGKSQLCVEATMQDVGKKLYQLKLQLANAQSSNNSEASSHNSKRHLKRRKRRCVLENAGGDA